MNTPQYTALYRWFETHRRTLPWRETTDPYLIWLSEIILQQTRVDQGLPYYLNFVKAFPTVDELAMACEDDVLRLWQGLGYYTRARNLYKGAQHIVHTYRHEHPASAFPDTFETLSTIPGVGEYTAGAIASFAYDLPYPALDGNVYRVLARLADIDTPFDTTPGKKQFRHLAEQWLDREHPRLFNAAIMEFGALHCTPQQPDCVHCPLQIYCQAYAHHTVEQLPVRKARPKVQRREMNYAIYLYRDASALFTLIHKRTEKDIWQHLWEFPQQSADAMSNDKAIKELHFTHVLSHQKLIATFRVYPVAQLPDIPQTTAIRWEELDDYALSRLTLKAIEQLHF